MSFFSILAAVSHDPIDRAIKGAIAGAFIAAVLGIWKLFTAPKSKSEDNSPTESKRDGDNNRNG